MFPSRGDWRSWDAIQKTTYLAQLLVPVSLLVTVVFSYLTWRESRIARELETQIFAAQSAPQVKLVEIFFPDTGGVQRPMMFRLKNEGDSTAEAVCVRATRLFGPEQIIWDSCEGQFHGRRLRKNETTAIHLAGPFKGKELDFIPARAASVGLDKPAGSSDWASLCGSLAGDNWMITISFKDALGKEDSRSEVIMVCGPPEKK